jgi:hypothetical protein
MREDLPASPSWSSSQVPLPPINASAGGTVATDRYSPSKEEARPQLLVKEADDGVGSKSTDNVLLSSQKSPARQKSVKATGRKSAPKTQQVKLKSSDGKEYFEVERIIDKRPIKGKKRKSAEPAGAMFEYKVKWLNFDKPSDNTWEPWENVRNCRELLLIYEAEASSGTIASSDSTGRVRVGGKRPRGTGVQNTVVGSGFVGGKRPRSSSSPSDGSGTVGKVSARRSHGSAGTGVQNGTATTATRPSLASGGNGGAPLPAHTVQRPRAQRLAKTAALHPSVAAEYEQAEADAQVLPTVSLC